MRDDGDARGSGHARFNDLSARRVVHRLSISSSETAQGSRSSNLLTNAPITLNPIQIEQNEKFCLSMNCFSFVNV